MTGNKDLQVTKDLEEIREKAKTPDYKCWLYKKIDGEVQSQIVLMSEAEELYKDGWELSPAKFHEEHAHNPAFQAMASDIASKMNQLANIDEITDKASLIELGSLYGLKLKKTSSVKNLRHKIKQEAGV